ncbi:MAG: type II 3-dehydroquinate dehydratase [Thermoleophilia bacterium]
MRTLVLLHGCNLNMLGQRDPGQYGTVTLAKLVAQVVEEARRNGMMCASFQTNHEGQLVEKIHELRLTADCMIINPGAWTHYSYAIRDALEMVRGPIVEVHLSDIENRKEEWRSRSVIRDVCEHVVSGKGPEGYVEAVGWLAERLGTGSDLP